MLLQPLATLVRLLRQRQIGGEKATERCGGAAWRPQSEPALQADPGAPGSISKHLDPEKPVNRVEADATPLLLPHRRAGPITGMKTQLPAR